MFDTNRPHGSTDEFLEKYWQTELETQCRKNSVCSGMKFNFWEKLNTWKKRCF